MRQATIRSAKKKKMMEKEPPSTEFGPGSKDWVLGAEEEAGIFSRLTYYYFKPLLDYGNKNTMNDKDLFPLGSRTSARYVESKFSSAWDQELKRSDPSIYRALKRLIGRELFLSSCCAFVGYEIAIVTPLILRLIILWIEERSKPTGQPAEYIGYLYVCVLFVIQLAQNFFTAQTFERGTRCGNWMRTALISAVFQKSLRLSPAARQNYTAGKIVNIMSTDISRIDLFMQLIHFVWVAPVQILTAFIILGWQLGWSALVALGIILSSAPVQVWSTKKLSEYRSKSSIIADERVKVTQEILAGIKVLKLYAWEGPFMAILENLRQRELIGIKWIHGVRACSAGLLQTVPILAAICAFIVFEVMGNTLTPSIAFTSLALFYSLRIPLLIYPAVISQLIDLLVAIRRIHGLLLADELDSAPKMLTGEAAEASHFAVKIINADF
eukprot:Partr_v1_DN28790_c0_g1_i1_m62407 putative ATP-binding cassette, sub-family C (CFTR MRP), member